MPKILTAVDADQTVVSLLDAQAALSESAAVIRDYPHVQAAMISSRVICSMPFTPLKFTRAQKRILRVCG